MRNKKDAAVKAVMDATGQTREDVLAANPALADQPAAATRPSRGAGATTGSTAVPQNQPIAL